MLVIIRYLLSQYRYFFRDRRRGNYRCSPALVHNPSDQAILGHLGDAYPAAAVREALDTLLRMQRAGMNDVRQILVALDHHVSDLLRIKNTLFVRGFDDLGVWFEMFPERDHALHPRQHQRSHPVPGVAEPFGVPHPLEEDQRVRFEVARRRLALAARVLDAADFVTLPCVEERHEDRRIDPRPVRRNDDQRIHLRRVEEIRVVVREQVVHRRTYPLPHRRREDMLGDPRPQDRRQHFGVIVDLWTGEVPVAPREVIAVARLVEADRGGEFVLEQLDVAEDRLGGAGEVEVFLNVGFAHLLGERGAVGVAVFLELGDQPDQALQLFLSDGHEASFLCVFTLFALNLTPMLGHFASKRKENSKKSQFLYTYYILTARNRRNLAPIL